MCTLTVRSRPSGILATMNRDEALGRAPENPPRIHADDAVRWMAPHDGEKGGTWMGVNEYGVVACLLNAYLPGESLLPDTSGHYRSRGEIIPAMLAQGGGAEAVAWIESKLEPKNYPSFMLLVFARDVARCYTWHKQEAMRCEDLTDAEWVLRSSSGWDSSEVSRWREERFDEWRVGGEEMVDHLPKFHLLQESGREDWSPLMKRSWSATRSVTQIAIDFDDLSIDLRYWPQPHPNSHHADAHLALPLIHPDSVSDKAESLPS
jgi:Transport and Golgi organisation 2